MTDKQIDDFARIRQTMEKVINENEYMQMLKIELLELKEGYAKARMSYQDMVLNPYGMIHGGALYSLADITAGTAACTNGHYVTTVSGSMNFMRPAVHTKYVYCTATEIRCGSHLLVYDIKIQDDNDVILQNGSYTFFNTEQPV